MSLIESENKQKNFGIELYRIFSMLFIMMFHFSDHGAVIITSDMPISFNWFVLAMSRIGGGGRELCFCTN